jgi:hypothetical protein
MKSLLSVAALSVAFVLPYAAPAAAQQSKDCGKYGMTCAPAGKNLNYTTGVQAKDCGLYGMSCAKSATTAAAPAAARAGVTTAAATPPVMRERVTTGRSVAVRSRTRVRANLISTEGSAAPVRAATTTTVQAGYGPAYGYGYQPAYWGYGYQPAYWSYGYQPAPAPVVTGRSVAVTTTTPAAPAAVVTTPATPGPVYWGGWYNPQPWGYGYAAPATWPWFW